MIKIWTGRCITGIGIEQHKYFCVFYSIYIPANPHWKCIYCTEVIIITMVQSYLYLKLMTHKNRNSRSYWAAANSTRHNLGNRYRVGFPSQFRYEKIPRNRLETVSVIPREKVFLSRNSFVSEYPFQRLGTEDVFKSHPSVFLRPWTGLERVFKSFRLLNGSERNYKVPSVFLLYGMVILRGMAQRNSERFPFRETDRILTKWIKISVCSVFRGKIFPRKMAKSEI